MPDYKEELAEYFNLPLTAIEGYLKVVQKRTAALWQRHNPKSKEEIEAWYQNKDVQQAYILELAQFWQLEQKRKDLAAFWEHIKANNCQNILDYGAGHGEVIVYLAKSALESYPSSQLIEFTYADYPGALREFAMWRVLKDNLPNVFFTDLRRLERQFDCIICLDVLEHCDDLPGTAKMLCDHLVPGGIFIVQVAFAFDPNIHPMHLRKNEQYRDKFNSELLPSFGMKQVSGWLWQKNK